MRLYSSPMAQTRDLPALREAIEAVDHELLHLLRRRMDLVEEVAGAKLEAASPFRDQLREDQILQRVRHFAVEEGLDAREVERLYRVILEMSVAHQKAHVRSLATAPLRVAYQGVEGSYSHLTAQRLVQTGIDERLLRQPERAAESQPQPLQVAECENGRIVGDCARAGIQDPAGRGVPSVVQLAAHVWPETRRASRVARGHESHEPDPEPASVRRRHPHPALVCPADAFVRPYRWMIDRAPGLLQPAAFATMTKLPPSTSRSSAERTKPPTRNGVRTGCRSASLKAARS